MVEASLYQVDNHICFLHFFAYVVLKLHFVVDYYTNIFFFRDVGVFFFRWAYTPCSFSLLLCIRPPCLLVFSEPPVGYSIKCFRKAEINYVDRSRFTIYLILMSAKNLTRFQYIFIYLFSYCHQMNTIVVWVLKIDQILLLLFFANIYFYHLKMYHVVLQKV